MMLIENKIVLNKEQEQFLNEVMGEKFQWIYTNSHCGFMLFANVILQRYYNNNSQSIENKMNSVNFKKVKDIFLSFCEQNHIKVETIYRASFNLTFSNQIEYGDVHVDHKFPHHNFILYLNDCAGNTILFDDDENIVKEVKPEKYKGFVFPGQKHSHRFCLPGENRFVLVVTFKGEQYK
jgi:hypothetical protein